MSIPFHQPKLSNTELSYVTECLNSGELAGDHRFTHRCHALLKETYGNPVLLMHSCTAALEAAALLIGLVPGDEVIMPSFTFVSTANAAVLRGAIPVFVDIRPDTLNIDETLIEAAITPRTRAIFPVHYAGVGADMPRIVELAAAHGLHVVEDAAQCFAASYADRALGSFGDLGCLSFHETKNIVSGEGGALIINNPEMIDRAYYIREKGTNRTQFMRGEIPKYEWIDIGSSFLPSDILAALLLAQLERADELTTRRREVWDRYQLAFRSLEEEGLVSQPRPTQEAAHNGHIYYLVGRDPMLTTAVLGRLKADGIAATRHYVPLHSAPAGRLFGRTDHDLPVTDRVAATLIRLPLFSGISEQAVDRVIDRTLLHVRAAGAA
ncbi:MAG TPA: dTDP-4-amino-4,6-dideoxygalactose transaminase [Acetobacteraceae bacterium]|nr:dTDP-4-amino-4,6-dideoxygalactose transaminase [Acetobacteraceae bacterium]